MGTSTETPQQESYNFSLKQKRQKTAAWICLGGGVIMTIVGIGINSVDEVVEVLTFNLGEVEDVHKGDWLIYLGGTTTLASIPLFISAGKNKKKATLSLKREPSSFRHSYNTKFQNTYVALTINF